MSKNSDKEEDIISELYAFVEAPEDYDAFFTRLHQTLAKLQAGDGSQNMDAMIDHMSRAASLVDMVTPWTNEDTSLSKALALRVQATLAADAKGKILDANLSAQVVFDVFPGGSIHDLPIFEEDAQRLGARIGQIARTPSAVNGANDVIKLHNVETDLPLLVRLEPHTTKQSGQQIVILRTSDVGWPQHLGPILNDLFDLSTAEIEVARRLVEGQKVKDIAQSRGASTTTVRSQLQSIFAKTGTRDQMECVRMISGLALMHDAQEGKRISERIQASKGGAYAPTEGQYHVATLPDGRKLEYSDFGGTSSHGILFYHDQVFGDVWFKDAVAMAEQRGLRIIAPLRPGYGRTSLYDGASSDPALFAPDVSWLLDELGLERVTVLAMGAGLMHGLAAAQLRPDKVVSVSACHPILPTLSDDDLEGTNGYNYLVPHARLHFPASLKFLIKAGFAFVMRSGDEAFCRMIMRTSPRDLEWITRPDILPIVVKGRRIHAEHGYRGTYGDLAYSGDWRPLITDCPVPIRFVVGEFDRNLQWGAVQRYADASEHVTLEVLQDSGYMVLHQKAGAILDFAASDLGV